MNFKKNLKRISFYIFLICLILIGLYIFRYKYRRVVFVPSTTLNPQSTIIPNSVYAKVTRVYDGDTIQIESGEKVRYIGMNSSEVYQKQECYSQEARRENYNLVMGKEVKLISDTSDKDKYGRLLRYVYVNDELINDKLVKAGFAKTMSIFPDIKYQKLFLESEKYAKESKLGLWGKCF